MHYQCTECNIDEINKDDLDECQFNRHEIQTVLDAWDYDEYVPSITQVEDYLNTQILDDPELVTIVLRTMLSAYTSNPLNLMIKASTSEGKTYAATQVQKIFPDKDVLLLGGMSPTALIHERGVSVDQNGNPIDEKLRELHEKLQQTKEKDIQKETDELIKNSRNLIDLSGKVLLYLDTPNWELWRKLKPILSHDTDKIEFKITDKKRGSLETKIVILKGWPAVIYCSAKNEEHHDDWDEIESRFIIVSPNTRATKYKKANHLTAKRSGTPDFASKLFQDPWTQVESVENIKKIKQSLKSFLGRNNVFNPFSGIIADLLPNKEGPSMRLSERFHRLCNLETLINRQNRCYLLQSTPTKTQKYPITNLKDIDQVIDLVGESNSISPEKIRFFHQIFEVTEKEHLGGITTAQLAEKYKSAYDKPITPKKILENFLNPLESIGLIEWKVDSQDKRNHLFYKVADISERKFDHIKTKIIDESRKSISFIRAGIEELQKCSSRDLLLEDCDGNKIDIEKLSQLLIESQTNNIENIQEQN